MQPRYGLTLKRKPTSGLSLVARISLVWSSYTCSSARGISSRYWTSVDDHGFGGLEMGRVFTRAMKMGLNPRSVKMSRCRAGLGAVLAIHVRDGSLPGVDVR